MEMRSDSPSFGFVRRESRYLEVSFPYIFETTATVIVHNSDVLIHDNRRVGTVYRIRGRVHYTADAFDKEMSGSSSDSEFIDGFVHMLMTGKNEEKIKIARELETIKKSNRDYRQFIATNNNRSVELALVAKNVREANPYHLRESLNRDIKQIKAMMQKRIIKDFFVHVGATGRVNGISFLTQDIIIEYKKNVYNFGKYECRFSKLSYNAPKIELLLHENNTKINGYIHPHADADSLCTGNMYETVKFHLKTGDILGAVVSMITLVNTYTDNDYHHAIENWNINEESHASCYSMSDPTKDCISCQDTTCFGYKDRFARCFDKMKAENRKEECINCQKCLLFKNWT